MYFLCHESLRNTNLSNNIQQVKYTLQCGDSGFYFFQVWQSGGTHMQYWICRLPPRVVWTCEFGSDRHHSHCDEQVVCWRYPMPCLTAKCEFLLKRYFHAKLKASIGLYDTQSSPRLFCHPRFSRNSQPQRYVCNRKIIVTSWLIRFAHQLEIVVVNGDFRCPYACSDLLDVVLDKTLELITLKKLCGPLWLILLI